MKPKLSILIITIGVLLTLSFSVSAQSLPTITMDKPIQDMTISELQAKIAEILSVIQQLQALIAQLQGGGVSCNFYRNLYPGISGSDVKCLQQYLNNTGHTVASSGPGSSNQETIYYGSLTRAAVKKWQDANNIEQGAWWGYFGPKSQAIYKEIAATTGEQEEPPTSGTYCGDNIAQRPSDQMIIEDCDGTDLRNKTCLTQGYTGGTLSCSNDCSFNTSLCAGTGPDIPAPPTPGPSTACGDSIMQKPNSEGIYEVCDRANLGTSTCLTYGYVGGTLSCSSNCITFNTTGCITESGGGGGGGGAPAPEPEPGPVCGDTDGICPSGCTYSQDTDCTYCGDSIIQSPNDEGISEVCDTASLTGETCITKGFPGGTLQCSSTCLTFDTSSCTWPEPPNEAPVLSPIGNKTTSENQQLSFTVSATDPDQDELSYSISDIPTGATFNASTRTFTWTPTYDQQGTYQTTFTVSDGSLTDTETITITVSNVNRAPILNSIGNKTVDENQTLTFTVSGTDLDNDPLYYSIIDTPSGASFDSLTRTFTWTPTYEQQGTYTSTFIVSDSEYTDQETITITVNNIVTGPACGDSICEGTETCSTCEADCGECPAGFPTDYISYWKFDSDATDSGPGGNDGTLVGDAQIVSDATRGNVLSLDGAGDYVDVGNDASLNITNAITVSAWAKFNSFSTYPIVASKWNSVAGGRSWMLGTDNTGVSFFRIQNADDSSGVSDSGDTLLIGVWYHLAGVYDGTDIIMYVNGSGIPTAQPNGMQASPYQVKIGVYATNSQPLDGQINDVMIYDRALSETEIQQIYNSQNECQTDNDCNDNNDCTINTCVGVGEAGADSKGCAVSFVSAGISCDDGLFCTTAGTSTCDGAGSCTGGTALDCSDTVACTDDSCNEVLDTCENTANDSNCPGGETCDVFLGCVADPCAGINDCGDYNGTSLNECEGNPCSLNCVWNSSLSACEDAPPMAYEGFGAVTRGHLDASGGYDTVHVTNLNNAGPGSFRDAVAGYNKHNRYVVFDVGGTITLTSSLQFQSSYVTIDGSTAPYPGITIYQSSGETLIFPYIDTGPVHDLIINNIRFVGGPGAGDLLAIYARYDYVYNVIFDHITMINTGDGTFDTSQLVRDITQSWSLMMDNQRAHYFGGREDLSNTLINLSIHHNVYARNNERQPYVRHQVDNVDFVNNVVYGWGWMGGPDAAGLEFEIPVLQEWPKMNVMNNYYHYVSGLSSRGEDYAIYYAGAGHDPDWGRVYYEGNIFPPGENDNVSRSAWHTIPPYAQVTMYEASTLGDTVVPYVGTHYPTQEEQALLSEISIALGASEARISQTDEKLNNVASIISSIQSIVQGIIEKMQSLF